ncbi:unnamed protein product [Prunus brigantina]
MGKNPLSPQEMGSLELESYNSTKKNSGFASGATELHKLHGLCTNSLTANACGRNPPT